jgi:hypothetical protein
MTTVLTIPIQTDRYTQLFTQYSPIQEVRLPKALEPQSRTDYCSADEFREDLGNLRLRRGIKNVGLVTMAVLACHVGGMDEGVTSRPVETQAMAGLELLSASAKNYAVAEFHEPLRFAWTRSAHRIRKAAKEFVERTHADY